MEAPDIANTSLGRIWGLPIAESHLGLLHMRDYWNCGYVQVLAYSNSTE